jgi:hypothetical protein
MKDCGCTAHYTCEDCLDNIPDRTLYPLTPGECFNAAKATPFNVLGIMIDNDPGISQEEWGSIKVMWESAFPTLADDPGEPVDEIICYGTGNINNQNAEQYLKEKHGKDKS